ncbi:hypothetical protein IKQ65_02865 [Candidatus Saccharibacteria bacterium]|nr:hypothetical protein [Candidatus Saccharibacteria bacterium]
MSRIIDIISPIYQDLIEKCGRRKISINLDFQDLSIKVEDDETVATFFSTEIKRALKNCEAGDKITLSQSSSANGIRFSVKNSAKTPLDAETADKLREKGYEVRSRFGYDTIISLAIAS